jgi:Protein of unknown function (DUF3667)
LPAASSDSESSSALQQCHSCGAPLSGEYCASCGQRRLGGRLTLRALLGDVLKRVFRLDKDFAITFWRMLRQPGRLVPDYLAGLRGGYLDPFQYFFSSVFVQVVVSAVVHSLAPTVNRETAVRWLGQLSGVVAIKLVNVFWMGTLWRLLFRPLRYNLAEIYVFAMYAFGTTGILWALLPLLDLAVPYPLGANPLTVLTVTLSTEVLYMTYAIWQFSGLPLWRCVLRVLCVLCVGYALLVGVIGVEPVARLLLPTLQTAH